MNKRRFNTRAFKAVLRLLFTFGGYLLIFVIAFHVDFVHRNIVQQRLGDGRVFGVGRVHDRHHRLAEEAEPGPRAETGVEVGGGSGGR